MPSKKSDVDKLVEALITGDHLAEFPLERLGAKAVPALVRAMDDPRACQPTQESPAILWIWETLIFHATPEIIARMAAFVDHESSEIRRGLYGKLVWYGSTTCAEALGRAWRTQQNDEREHLYLSVRRQARSTRDRWEPGFATAIYDLIAEELRSGAIGTYYHVAETLLDIDPKRARQFFMSPEVFRADNPDILGVLIALEAAKCVVPAPALVAMLPALRESSDAAAKGDGSRPGAPYEVAMLLLARSDPKAARPLVEDAIRSDNEYRRESAR